MTTVKLPHNVLLVGEAPTRTGPKFPRPGDTPTGKRIAALGGQWIPRCNLLTYYPGQSGKGAHFPLSDGREAAQRLLRRTPKRVTLVFMGKRVANAFGWQGDYLKWGLLNGREIVTMPHPSGVNRWWNDPRNVELASQFVASLKSRA